MRVLAPVLVRPVMMRVVRTVVARVAAVARLGCPVPRFLGSHSGRVILRVLGQPRGDESSPGLQHPVEVVHDLPVHRRDVLLQVHQLLF